MHILIVRVVPNWQTKCFLRPPAAEPAALWCNYLSTYPERCCEHGAEAIGYFEDGVMRGVAEMHPDESDNSTAEVAFSVESRHFSAPASAANCSDG
jgi:hypothetical protein